MTAHRFTIGTMSSILQEACSSLLAHPLRSFLTSLSVAFGSAALMVLLSYGSGVPDTTATLLRSMGSKEFIVEPRRSRGRSGARSGRPIRIRYADLAAIRDACPSIDGIAPAYRPGRGGPAFSSNRSWPWVNLTAVGFEYQQVTDLQIRAGRWFTQEEDGRGGRGRADQSALDRGHV